MLPITGTFLDEISHDIPHQNWGVEEWDRDFSHMYSMGIDTVILIRCGHKKWMTYPSDTLLKHDGFRPPLDLVDMFLRLSEKYGLNFYFGLYDSGEYWWVQGDFQKEIDINKRVVEEVWRIYGNRKSFKGWYLCQEVSRKMKGAIDLYRELGAFCKSISGGLPTIISPYIDGSKAILSSQSTLSKADAITLENHEREWSEILDAIASSVDIVAFQDGHVPLDLLKDYLIINKQLIDQYGMQCWTNAESFDRDMPIKFLPIKWEKLLLKLQAAEQAGIRKGITFEFSHFMSPQSSYIQAHHLYNRYQNYLNGLE